MTRVLIADDNEDILESTAMLLELRGFEVSAVSEGSRVLHTMKETRPDVCLQDVHMPGFDLVQHLELVQADADLASIPILVFTASAPFEDTWKRRGAVGLVRKPFKADELADTLRDVVGLQATAGDAEPSPATT